MMTEEKYLTLSDVAERINVSERTARRLVTGGQISAYQFGGAYRVAESDLRDYIERSRVRADDDQ